MNGIRNAIKKIPGAVRAAEIVREMKRKFKRAILSKGEFLPFYNQFSAPSEHYPEIYNKNGERMEVFFIHDRLGAHVPHGFSQKILWDRYNFGLNTHFYTHGFMLETVGNPVRKYGWLLESEAITPRDYKIFDKHRGLNNEFGLIFTHSEEILNKYANARFAPGNGVWYGLAGDARMSPEAYKFKNKNVSIIASGKNSCELHVVRAELAKRLKKIGTVDTFGTFDGGARIEHVDCALTDYRYSIAFENHVNSLYFTEKLLNCFASMSVPIYVGATKIGDFFNLDGMINISLQDLETPEKILAQCSERDYEQRLPAIKDNYERVQKFLTVEDYIYDNYLKN